jgi:hypothetical protein
MKKLLILMISILAIFIVAGPALANGIEFGFSGDYTISDQDSDGFSETIMFSSLILPGSNGIITSWTPGADPLFLDAGIEYVSISDLTLDPGNYSSNSWYAFNPTLYPDGFGAYDDDDTLLFDADLTVQTLQIVGTTALINPFFTLNLSDITVGLGYTMGSSPIIDAFANAPGGAMQITLQFGDENLPFVIESGAGDTGTYSGTAAPIPEPATMLLLGSGLVGLAGLGRKKFLKKA